MSNAKVINYFKEVITNGKDATLFLGDSVHEVATGNSRGEGSISVWGETPTGMMEVNDEARGFHGTQRKESLLRIADEELKVADDNGYTLRIVEGKHRNRRSA